MTWFRVVGLWMLSTVLLVAAVFCLARVGVSGSTHHAEMWSIGMAGFSLMLAGVIMLVALVVAVVGRLGR